MQKGGSRTSCAHTLFLAWLLLVAVTAFWGARSVAAQTAGTGTISGTISDPSGATIAAATVEVRDTDTGIVHTITTDDSGLYYAPFLQPGHYVVDATKEGFAKVERKDILLEVGSKLAIDLALPLKTTAETITVTGEAPLIEPDKTDLSQTVSQTLAVNLPLNGRRWENFVLLTPGVTNDGIHGLISYHGVSGLFNNSAVDGTSNQQAFFSEDRGRTTVAYTYSLDAIQEFQVTSNAFSAEFGQAAGGVVITAMFSTTCATPASTRSILTANRRAFSRSRSTSGSSLAPAWEGRSSRTSSFSSPITTARGAPSPSSTPGLRAH